MTERPSVVKPLPSGDSVVPNKLAHLVLKTNQFQQMVRWYCLVLNARVVIEKPHVAFLTYDDEHHRLAICNIPQLAAKQRDVCGMDHIAFTYSDLGALLANYRRLAALGIKPRWPINHGNTISLYYEDPDRNRVELQKDIFDTAAEVEHYMADDPDYHDNPLGAPFDPELMIARYESGVPFKELVKVPKYPSGSGPINTLQDMGYIIGQAHV